MESLNVYGAGLSPHNLQFALTNSGLKWRMHPAQYTAVVNWSLEIAVDRVRTATVESLSSDTLFKTLPAFFFYGLPIEVDKDMPESKVYLIYKDKVIFTIEAIAVLNGFYDEKLNIKT